MVPLPIPDPGRRLFLRRSAVLVPGGTLALAACAQDKGSASVTPPSPATAPSVAYQPVFFQPAEWVFLHAAVARLIPADENGPGALEAGVPEFIDRQMDAIFGNASLWYMQGPYRDSAPEFGYQDKLAPRDVYRAGIAAIDRHCEATLGVKSFSLLAPTAQDTLLQALESGTLTLAGANGKAFFGFLLQNTREGYLSDPMHGGNKNAAAWAMIGFPGARADYADWVGRAGEHYPLPPVSINGPQG
jgi:gluconate 2-dehydrogenase gamma chain